MEILTKLIIIFAISTIYVEGKISSTKIKDDAAKMVEIYRIYTMSSQNTVYHIFSAQCSTIGYCCTDIFNQTFDILDSHALEEKCINHPELILEKYKTECSQEKTYLKMIEKSSEYGRFMKLHRGVAGSDQLIRNWRSQMKKACNANELSRYYCFPNDMDTFQSCQVKMLQSLANKNGGKNYDAFLHNWINDFTTYNKRIAKAFPQSN
ncbi:unnamed protein product [Adineta steineri]|uniref:Uncharacterized protein n=1 Tax=Adineta steineri TaxID=433720 RepID=A0A816AW44_9BILA|nr:unnamed protein product [Adineta steineri]CAF1603413.1 unnamed protein product [Adineta steineri]